MALRQLERVNINSQGFTLIYVSAALKKLLF